MTGKELIAAIIEEDACDAKIMMLGKEGEIYPFVYGKTVNSDGISVLEFGTTGPDPKQKD